MFVQRDKDGHIVGAFAVLQAGFAEEFLPENSQELVDFYKRASGV